MIKLSELFQDLPIQYVEDIEIKAITNDSRQIDTGSLFLAEQGILSHGLVHIDSRHCELTAGIVYQPEYDIKKFAKYQHKFFSLDNLNQHISKIAQRFYQPQFADNLIGVTGTNGKTSTVFWLSKCLNNLDDGQKYR